MTLPLRQHRVGELQYRNVTLLARSTWYKYSYCTWYTLSVLYLVHVSCERLVSSTLGTALSYRIVHVHCSCTVPYYVTEGHPCTGTTVVVCTAGVQL